MDTLKSADQAGQPQSEINGQSLRTADELGHLDLESAQSLLHALLWGVHFDFYDENDYLFAGGFSQGVRTVAPRDCNWLKAQIAACWAGNLDPKEEFSNVIGADPSLDQTAVLPGSWPRSFSTSGSRLNAIETIFFALCRCHQTAFHTNDSRHSMPKHKRRSLINESLKFAIRAVVCLFGQAGLDTLLRYEMVQCVLKETPIREFEKGRDFPNIIVPAR